MKRILFPFDIAVEEDHVKNELACPVVLISGTFLGNQNRNYYGENPPDALDVIWKTKLGTGTTIVGSRGETRWSGSGWTGQPLLIEHAGELYLIQGAFDHNLKKIKAQNGEIVWQYRFDDIIKGTGTAVCMPWLEDTASSVAIVQGSRLGVTNTLRSPAVLSLRAVSFFTGEELWSFDVRKTRSYSRDADGSGLFLDSLFYIGLENGIFTVLDPDPSKGEIRQGVFQPRLIGEIQLYDEKDVESHGGNLVIESSVSRIGDILYVTAGSGHVFGIDVKSLDVVWDFYIGSDLDGSPVVTYDSCLLVSVEKQYIPGRGGVFKLDPSKEPDSAVVWYFPTGDRRFGDWQGGVIGTCAVNDHYRENEDPALAAFVAIDGNIYVV
ncbi:PQQ-like beta-propeller repeat protein, partial [candidate division WOR-3 bacterium]|nr:PQQ-like beta-propeller repeat protein [candidate division WOR-3 bacterium]